MMLRKKFTLKTKDGKRLMKNGRVKWILLLGGHGGRSGCGR